MTSTVAMRLTVLPENDIDVDEEARQLRTELRESDHEVVLGNAVLGSPPPPGARSGEMIEAGVVLLTAMAQPEVMGALLTQVGDWIRRRGRRGRVEIEVDGHRLVLDQASPEERRALVDGYVRKVLTPRS